jgi:hypothetical protein
VLATAQDQNGATNQVWDISNAASATPVADASSFLVDGDWLSAVAIAADGEMLVLSASSGLFAFDSCGKYLGAIEPIFQNAHYIPGDGEGLAYVPQPDGGPAVVVIGDGDDGLVAFNYGGAGDFDGGALDTPIALWPTAPTGAGVYQCFPGPGNTVYAAGTDSSENPALEQFHAVTGASATGIAPPLSDVYGGAMDSNGNILITGDDETLGGGDFGAAELYNANPSVTDAVTGAPLCTDLSNCVSGSCNCQSNVPSLGIAGGNGDAPDLGQAAALPGGGFVVVYENESDFGAGPPYSTILLLAPDAGGLTVSTYYTAGATGPTFFGLASAPP